MWGSIVHRVSSFTTPINKVMYHTTIQAWYIQSVGTYVCSICMQAGMHILSYTAGSVAHQWGMYCGRSWWSSGWGVVPCHEFGWGGPNPECCSPHSSDTPLVLWNSTDLWKSEQGNEWSLHTYVNSSSCGNNAIHRTFCYYTAWRAYLHTCICTYVPLLIE